MTKYTRIAPIEAFQIPGGWEDEPISTIYDILKDFQTWGENNRLLSSPWAVHTNQPVHSYWGLAKRDRMVIPLIEIIHFGDARQLLYANLTDWVVHEIDSWFSVWGDNDFRQQYQPIKK